MFEVREAFFQKFVRGISKEFAKSVINPQYSLLSVCQDDTRRRRIKYCIKKRVLVQAGWYGFFS